MDDQPQGPQPYPIQNGLEQSEKEFLEESRDWYQFLLQLSDALRPIADPFAVEEIATRLAMQYLDADRCYYCQVVEGMAIITRDARRDHLPSVAGTYPLSSFPLLKKVVDKGRPFVVDDAHTSPILDEELRAICLQLHVIAFLNVPVIKQGDPVGVLCLVQSRPRIWTEHEIQLQIETAERTWAAVERTSAEAAFRDSQKGFEAIANLVPDLLWDSGPDGFTNWYNQRWLAYTGQRFEEAIGWGWTDAIHPDDRQTSTKLYKQAVETGNVLRQEHRIRRHDGAYRWFVVCVSPLRDERGQVVKMYGAASDIHETKLAEAALQESEKRLRLAIEATELATWEWNLDTDLVYWNEQHFRLFGMEPRPNPLLPAEFMRHVHPREQARINHLLEQAIAGRSVYEAEFCAVLEDGSQRYMSGYGRITEERDGRPITMSGVMVDVDDRRRAQDALRQSEERLQKALSIQTVGVTFFDRQTTIQATNQAFLAMSGVSQQAIDQRSVSLIELTLPPWRPLCQQAITELMMEGRSRPHEKELLRPDGTRWWGLFAGSRLSEDEFVEFVLDVTERRRAEEALRLADGRKDEFLAMLAHELRNPMATIRSGLQILSITDGKDQTSSDTLAMMKRQTDHLVRMVDDLLDVSRITQGKIELRQERVNLVSLIQQAVTGCQPLFDQQGKRLYVKLPLTPIELEGDATRLTQVVTNLLTNGVRYTGEGGQVWLSLSHHQHQAILQVRDNGIGLATDQLTTIFELFVQVDQSTARSKGGLGLGLTLVKRLVALHGGYVEAHSEGLGRGSTFTVHLPTLAVAVEPSARSTPQASDSLTSRHILVIDDNEDAAFTLAMLLKLKGYEAHTRTSGRSGIEAAETLRPSAILLDIGMPDLDGYATCGLIRERPWGKDVMVIALTGYGQAADRQRTREAGFNGHLVKPVDLEALTKLLTDLLSKDQNRAGLE